MHKQVRNLEVVFDSDLKMDKQVNSVMKAGYFHLRNIAKIKQFLSLAHYTGYTGFYHVKTGLL